jgi:small-conductance mechanosensitive channel
MSKPLINRIFVGSLAAIIAGILLALVTVAAVLCTGTWTFSGSDVTAFEPASAVGWTFGFAIVGGLLFIAGWLGQFVAWIGALVNTARLADKTWFVVLLVTGLLSFGFIAMLVYVLAGPDGTLADRQTAAAA